eukprot:PhF_6_TR32605/c0_g1_i1/m.48227
MDKKSGKLKHVVSEFRWGRQFFLQSQISHNDQGSRTNPFFSEFSERMRTAKGPTKIVFMLVTPNPVDWKNKVEMEEFLKSMNTTEKGEGCRCAQELRDEVYVSLKSDMENWCPTIAYASTAAFSIRGIIP